MISPSKIWSKKSGFREKSGLNIFLAVRKQFVDPIWGFNFLHLARLDFPDKLKKAWGPEAEVGKIFIFTFCFINLLMFFLLFTFYAMNTNFYLKHFKSCQQFTSFIGASEDLKPFQLGSYILFFTKKYIRFAYGPSQEFSFADLKKSWKAYSVLFPQSTIRHSGVKVSKIPYFYILNVF